MVRLSLAIIWTCSRTQNCDAMMREHSLTFCQLISASFMRLSLSLLFFPIHKLLLSYEMCFYFYFAPDVLIRLYLCCLFYSMYDELSSSDYSHGVFLGDVKIIQRGDDVSERDFLSGDENSLSSACGKLSRKIEKIFPRIL